MKLSILIHPSLVYCIAFASCIESFGVGGRMDSDIGVSNIIEMGTTTSNEAGGQPQGPARPPNNEGQGKPPDNGKDQKGQGQDKKPPPNHGLVYDEELKKYYDPISGESVATPGRFEPEPEKRPLRVKVRKRQHYKLRKRRRKPKPLEKTPSPEPPKALRPATKYDPDGYPMYYTETGDRILYDEDGHLIPPEPYEDDEGYLRDAEYDDFGNLLVYDHFGIMVENDENGDPTEYDRYGYPILYDENGQPVERTYYPRYDEFGNELPPPKKKEVTYPDDGYDYDDSIYTYTTLDSPPLPTPSPVSSDDVQEKDDSGDDLSMEDVYDFHWRPFQPIMPKDEARASIKIGGEDCNCFPRRSDPLIPSMVYDKIECHHSNNVIGHAHTAVTRFEDNWNDKYTTVHKPRRQNRQRSKVTQVWGYPNRQFPYQEGGGALYEGGLRGEFQKPNSRKSTTEKTAEQTKEGGASASGENPKTAKSGGKDEKPASNKNGKKEDEGKKGKAEKKDEKKNKDKDKKASQQGSKAGVAAADGSKEANKDKEKEDAKKASQQGSKKDGAADKDAKKEGKEEATTNKKSSQSQKDKKAEADVKKKEEESKQKEKEKGARPLSREKMKQGLAQDNKGRAPMKKGNERGGNKSRSSLVVKSFLPRIGYTPDQPFSNGATPADKARSPPPGNRAETPLMLPAIPASPAFSIVSGGSVSQDMYSVHADIPTSRKFEGKYYDPVTKKTYTYDIKPKFGKHVQDWDALRQV